MGWILMRFNIHYLILIFELPQIVYAYKQVMIFFSILKLHFNRMYWAYGSKSDHVLGLKSKKKLLRYVNVVYRKRYETYFLSLFHSSYSVHLVSPLSPLLFLSQALFLSICHIFFHKKEIRFYDVIRIWTFEHKP